MTLNGSNLQLSNVAVTHAAGSPWAVHALHEVNLTLQSGDRVLIVGGNGSGKSTLLGVLAGLTAPTKGTCLLDGAPVAEQPERVGLLLQNTRLQLARPTVSEELEDMATDPAEVPGVVRRLGLAPLLGRRIDELSGGQQRRVGLAGAILRGADLLLLDEPMAGLDTRSAAGLLDAMAVLPSNAIVVVVTHDLDATAAVLDQGRTGRVIRIDRGRVTESERT